ncbi:hypothetical protein WHE01_08750 [Weissella hellenica]|nr:hypothetical protein WHE01_08750 [Weissella hellenica]
MVVNGGIQLFSQCFNNKNFGRVTCKKDIVVHVPLVQLFLFVSPLVISLYAIVQKTDISICQLSGHYHFLFSVS